MLDANASLRIQRYPPRRQAAATRATSKAKAASAAKAAGSSGRLRHGGSRALTKNGSSHTESKATTYEDSRVLTPTPTPRLKIPDFLRWLFVLSASELLRTFRRKRSLGCNHYRSRKSMGARRRRRDANRARA